jgi:hypothetical protein
MTSQMQLLKVGLSEFCNANNFGITIYAITKNNSSLPQKIDIENDALPKLQELFLKRIKESIVQQDDMSLLNLSSADERKKAIYLYDLEIPQDLLVIESVLQINTPQLLDMNSNQLSNIKALLIEIGNSELQLILYKTLMPVNIFTRANFFLIKSKNRMKQINDEFLRISADFQLFRFNDNLYVINLEALERSFGFREIIQREARVGIQAIAEKGLLEDSSVLNELLNKTKYARQLTKIAQSSPVLQNNIENKKIINFCKEYPKLVGKIRFNDTDDKIVLNTNISKELFLKLLMDDFLFSELTQNRYESLAKDNVRDSIETS